MGTHQVTAESQESHDSRSVNVDRLILYSSFFDLTLGPTFLQISLRTHE